MAFEAFLVKTLMFDIEIENSPGGRLLSVLGTE